LDIINGNDLESKERLNKLTINSHNTKLLIKSLQSKIISLRNSKMKPKDIWEYLKTEKLIRDLN
jgi:hypothetical protein